MPEGIEGGAVRLDVAGAVPIERELREPLFQRVAVGLPEEGFAEVSAPAPADDEPVADGGAEAAAAFAAEARVVRQEAESPFAGRLRGFAGQHREGDEHQVVHKVNPFRLLAGVMPAGLMNVARQAWQSCQRSSAASRWRSSSAGS